MSIDNYKLLDAYNEFFPKFHLNNISNFYRRHTGDTNCTDHEILIRLLQLRAKRIISFKYREPVKQKPKPRTDIEGIKKYLLSLGFTENDMQEFLDDLKCSIDHDNYTVQDLIKYAFNLYLSRG